MSRTAVRIRYDAPFFYKEFTEFNLRKSRIQSPNSNFQEEIMKQINLQSRGFY